MFCTSTKLILRVDQILGSRPVVLTWRQYVAKRRFCDSRIRADPHNCQTTPACEPVKLERMSIESICVFCDRVAATKPLSRVHEDDVSLGFMGRRPIHPGELLIIPKEHIDHFSDLPDELAAHIVSVAQRLSRRIRRILEPRRVGLVVHGFGVPHAHLSVVPLERSMDITSARYAQLESGELSFSEEQVPLASQSELDEVAALLSGQSLSWVRMGPP